MLLAQDKVRDTGYQYKKVRSADWIDQEESIENLTDELKDISKHVSVKERRIEPVMLSSFVKREASSHH